jgi:hypothetical protein
MVSMGPGRRVMGPSGSEREVGGNQGRVGRSEKKYVFKGNQIRNKFSYRNFLKFGLEFKLKFKEALGFEFQ